MLKRISFWCALAVALATASTTPVAPDTEVDPETEMENFITSDPWAGLDPWADATNETESEEANDTQIFPSGGHRIVGGYPARMVYHPHQVSVHTNSFPLNVHCGGSIISDRLVLTAAHCVLGPPPAYFVLAGSTYFNEGVKYRVTEIFRHPYRKSVNRNVLDYDVAVMRIYGRFSFGSYIHAIPLATRTPAEGVRAKAAGWGRTQRGIPSPVLLEVDLPIISRETCKRFYGNMITPSMFCAGYARDSHGTCIGDAGGPLVYNGKQVGVVSWGNRCDHWRDPGVFVNVAFVRSWIMGIVNLYGQ